MKTAQDIIAILQAAGAEDEAAIKAALLDGRLMVSLGIEEEDQEAVEEAYELYCK